MSAFFVLPFNLINRRGGISLLSGCIGARLGSSSQRNGIGVRRSLTSGPSVGGKSPNHKKLLQLIKKYGKVLPENVKKNDAFNKPLPRRLSPGTIGPNWPFVDREESLSKIIQLLFSRWETIDKDPTKLDKSVNPLIGCQSVSGGGKSTLMDQLVVLELDPNEKPKWLGNIRDGQYQKYAPDWRNALFITITFNMSDYEKYSNDPREDIAIRMLHSYIASCGGKKHLKKVEPDMSRWFNLEETLAAIVEHYQFSHNLSEEPRVVIVVDEASKSACPTTVLSELCQRMEAVSSAWKSIDVISTTLTETMLREAMSYSNRAVEFIPMPMLKSIQKLFPPDKNLNATIVALHLGGHARTLAALNVLLMKDPKICDGDLVDVFERLRSSLPIMVPDSEVVEKALLLQNEQQSRMDYLMGCGYVLNKIQDKDPVPHLSIYQLYVFSSQMKEFLVYPSALEALTLMEIKDRTIQSDVSSGHLFEQFHAQWKCMIATLRGQSGGWNGTLSKYYNNGLYFAPHEAEELEIISKAGPRVPAKLKMNFWEYFKKYKLGTNVVYQMHDTQAGFDIVQAWHEGPGSDCLILELTETIYSDPQRHEEITSTVDARMKYGRPAPMSLEMLLKKKALVDRQLTQMIDEGWLSFEKDERVFQVRSQKLRRKLDGASKIKPVLIFATDNDVNVDDYSALWKYDDRFAIAMLPRSGLVRAYGRSLFDPVKFRPIITELMSHSGLS